MLSKIELEFLKSPENFEANYAYVLKHRIKGKIQAMQEEIGLLGNAGFLNLTKNCNLTEFRKNGENQQGLNQVAFAEIWSLRRDLDPRPLPYQGNAPPG